MSCCGFNNNCSCDRCEGVRMSQFNPALRASANQQVVLSDNTLLSVSQLGNYYMLGNVTVSWGMIDGTLSNQADLQDELNLKAPLDGATMINSTYNGVDLVSTGLPTEFLASDGNYYLGTTSVTWGGITGTLSDQTDLQAALDNKEDIVSVKEVTSPYTVLEADDVLIVNGTDTVTLPAGFNGKTVYSVDGCSLSVTPENVPALIPAGQSYTLYYRTSTGSYIVA